MLQEKRLRCLVALWCSLLLLTASVGRALHILIEHHDEQPEKHCHAEHGTAHIHSPEYGHTACALCDFVFSSALPLPSVPRPTLLETLEFVPVSHLYRTPVCIEPLTLSAPRGPPAA